MNIVFFSTAQKACLRAVEDLLYFNPRQERVREGIAFSLELFGAPQVVVDRYGVCIRVGGNRLPTLFAYDLSARNGHDPKHGNGDPVGLVVYSQTDPEVVTVVHLAVHPDYTVRGCHGGPGLAVVLMDKVKDVASRLGGVRRLVLAYRPEIVLTL